MCFAFMCLCVSQRDSDLTGPKGTLSKKDAVAHERSSTLRRRVPCSFTPNAGMSPERRGRWSPPALTPIQQLPASCCWWAGGGPIGSEAVLS